MERGEEKEDEGRTHVEERRCVLKVADKGCANDGVDEIDGGVDDGAEDKAENHAVVVVGKIPGGNTMRKGRGGYNRRGIPVEGKNEVGVECDDQEMDEDGEAEDEDEVVALLVNRAMEEEAGGDDLEGEDAEGDHVLQE